MSINQDATYSEAIERELSTGWIYRSNTGFNYFFDLNQVPIHGSKDPKKIFELVKVFQKHDYHKAILNLVAKREDIANDKYVY